MTIRIEVFGRPGCHLCDQAKEALLEAREVHGFELREVNIETDPHLEANYGTRIPVVTINGEETFLYRVDPVELERRLLKLCRK